MVDASPSKSAAPLRPLPTDKVLQKLLPHTDTDAHKKSGVWIFIAPAITGDIKTWFEAVGWTQPSDWPKIAGLAVLLGLLAFLIVLKGWPYQSCRDTDHLSSGTCVGIISNEDARSPSDGHVVLRHLLEKRATSDRVPMVV